MNIETTKYAFVVLLTLITTSAFADKDTVEKAQSLLAQSDYKAASAFIDEALDKFPDNAAVHNSAGGVYGARAQNSSIITAPSHAKKSLKHLKEAVRLEPSNADYRMGLMMYYLAAPGIVGGDTDLGKLEAEEINQLNPVDGFVANAAVYQITDQPDALKGHYESIDSKIADHPEILLSQAGYYQTLEQYSLSSQVLDRLINLKPAENSSSEDVRESTRLKHLAYYQYGMNSVLGKTNLDKGINAFRQFLTQSPNDYQLPPKPWAKLRLAQLYIENGNESAAKPLLAEVKTESNDKRLKKELKKTVKHLK